MFRFPFVPGQTRALAGLLLIPVALLLGSPGAGAALPPLQRPSPEAAGQALAAELRAQHQPLQTDGTLRRRDDDGRWLVPIRVSFEVTEARGSWQSIYRAYDAHGLPIETLVVTRAENAPNQYEYIRWTNGSAPPAPLVLRGNESMRPFADSDFWLCDLGLEFLSWPQQRIVKTEMRKSRSCRVLESINPQPPPDGYARVLSWVDIETNGLLRAEAFGADGRLLKEFSIGSFKKVNGRHQLKSMEIRNERTDRRTRLEFDLELAVP